MTPKEKARELRDKMYLKIPSVYDPTAMPHFPIAKECALIAVDEILKLHKKVALETLEYYQQVKIEIQAL
jgi:hypothetical protein